MSVFNIHEFRQRKKRERLAREAADPILRGTMSKSHLKTAHEWGVQQALEQVGYKSIEDVQKEAAALGLIEEPQTPAPTSTDKIAELFRSK